MHANRRQFISLTAAGGIALASAGAVVAAPGSGVKPVLTPAKPITASERNRRIAHAQELMRAQGLSLLVVEPGSSLNYFTGVRWWRSERLTAAVLPVEGEIGIITPGFEEPSIREMLAVPGEIRVWQEDEDPLTILANWLRELKLAGGAVGIENTVRFFVIDGLRKALSDVAIKSSAAVINGCRMIKSPAEIALMQHASDITVEAYRDVAGRIERGMTNDDIFQLMRTATLSLGGETPSGGVQIGEGSAYPHGSKVPQVVRNGSVILMDCGCTVEGYHSDISRTFVFGEANKIQGKVWNEVHRGQEIALAAAKVGAPAGSVDDAVRAYYEKLGYGPGYETPGLPHRTGHGIGLDVHEPVNLVHGEMKPLEEGMCFSNEPGLYLPGKFGVRLEDCFYMTSAGPRYFSKPPPSVEDPFA